MGQRIPEKGIANFLFTHQIVFFILSQTIFEDAAVEAILNAADIVMQALNNCELG